MSKNIFERMHLIESDAPATTMSPSEVGTVPNRFTTPPKLDMPTFSAPMLDAEDEARMKAIEAQVYAIPSTYLIFRNVRETLGSTTDVASVFRVLAAANPGVTAAKIRGDIDTHLGVIDPKRSAFDAQIAQARAAKIDGPKQQIADLTRANEKAKQEIAANQATIDRLQQSVVETEKALSDGQARFKLIEDQLSTPLNQAKQLLGGMQ